MYFDGLEGVSVGGDPLSVSIIHEGEGEGGVMILGKGKLRVERGGRLTLDLDCVDDCRLYPVGIEALAGISSSRCPRVEGAASQMRDALTRRMK